MTDALRSRTVVIGTIVFAVLVIAASLTGALQTRGSPSRTDPGSTELAVLAAARSESVALTTIRYDSAAADLDRVLAGATGALRTQFEKEKSALPATLQQNKSSSVGHVLTAGLESLTGQTAKVVVATDATVTGTDVASAGVLKHYRMVVSLQQVDGHWLASNVAFAGTPQ